MKIPRQFVITTSEYVHIQTKLNCYIAKYGCKAISAYLDSIPLRMQKHEGKNIGAYIVNKVCQEFQITQFDLFESTGRQHITDARKVLCALVDKYMGTTQEELSSQFGRSRHFAKRMIGDMTRILKANHPLDQHIITQFKRLDALVSAYKGFEPKTD